MMNTVSNSHNHHLSFYLTDSMPTSFRRKYVSFFIERSFNTSFFLFFFLSVETNAGEILPPVDNLFIKL